MPNETMELSPEEAKLINETRTRRLPPGEVIERAARDYHAEQKAGGGAAAAAAAEKKPDPSEIVEAAVQRVRRENLARDRQREIAGVIHTTLKDTEFTDPEDVEQIEATACKAVKTKLGDRLGKVSDAELNAALAEATKAEVDRRRKKSGTADSEALEERVEAIDKTVTGTGGGSRSTKGTPRAGGKDPYDPFAGEEMEFGLGTKWPTESEVIQKSARAARKFIKDHSGKAAAAAAR